jgi:hypothetical protein
MNAPTQFTNAVNGLPSFIQNALGKIDDFKQLAAPALPTSDMECELWQQ